MSESTQTVVNRTVIRETPGVCGGYPCIDDMRFPVRLSVEFVRHGVSVDTLLTDFTQLTRDQVEAALEYYRQHPARVDEDIERNVRAWEELQSRGWPG